MRLDASCVLQRKPKVNPPASFLLNNNLQNLLGYLGSVRFIFHGRTLRWLLSFLQGSCIYHPMKKFRA